MNRSDTIKSNGTKQKATDPLAGRMLVVTTLAWSVCFAAWSIFSIIGVRIQTELGLTESQFGLLISLPILTGSVARLFLGIASERFGGRWVTIATMLVTALSTWLLTWAQTYGQFLLAALGVGLAGAVFMTGIAFLSRWYPNEQHGAAFGLFGVGQVGAAVTNFGAPLLLVALGWQGTAKVYAIAMALSALMFWLFTKEDPVTLERRKNGVKGVSLRDQLAPLRFIRVWRFSYYYFFVFGGFVALASWLPRYYMAVYNLDIQTAGMLTAIFSLSAAVFRALGGILSDRFGARAVLYWAFWASMACLLVLSYPPTTYIIEGIDGNIQFHMQTHVSLFVLLTFVLGFAMSLGMAAVFKHIPFYFPHSVGPVGGLVGMIGGLGGFFLPLFFGVINDLTNIWTTAFMLLFGVVGFCLLWMHLVILRMARRLDTDPAYANEQRAEQPEHRTQPLNFPQGES